MSHSGRAMRIVVIGAGEVGSNIAANLAENHDVVVVDIDPEKVETLNYSHDVLAMEGDGTSLATLREAGIDEADMLIASTNDDETNLVACGTAKTVGDAFTIARVRKAEYLETWSGSEGAFGVDLMVSTDVLIAEDIIRIVELPSAVDVDSFAGGEVQMAEFEVSQDSSLAGKTVAESDRFEALTFAAIVHDGEIIIPRGDTAIEAGDRLIVIGHVDSMREFAGTVAPAGATYETNDFVIVGGGDVGYQTARLLDERGLEPRLIEWNAERARRLAEDLPRSIVMEHDATEPDFLVEENVDRADVVVAATGSDAKNLLILLLAKKIGAPRTVAVVEKGEYAELFEAVGVDVAINPREITAEEIVRFTRGGQIESLSLIEGRQAEVLEIEVGEESALTGRPIRESAAQLPAEVVIGAITRGREFVVPRGDTVIQTGDHVVLFVATDALSELMALV